MAIEIRMPKLGLTMEEGTINEWLIEVGEKVDRGEILATIETDKVTIDFESPVSGFLLKKIIEEGKTVPISELIAYIGAEGEEIQVRKNELIAASTNQKRVKDESSSKHHETAKVNTGVVAISPIAKRLAKENSIDYKKIKGTGPRGRIIEADILSLLENNKNTTDNLLVFKLEQPNKTKKITSERMSKSFQTAPHFYLNKEIEMVSAAEKRLKLNKSNVTKITFTDLIIKSLALSLKEFPFINAEWSSKGIKVFQDINIGFAVATESGLVVVVIQHCDKKSITEIAEERAALIQRAKNNQLTTEDISNGTFTLTNLGMYAIDSFSPILNPPQAGILATGAIFEKPIVRDSEILPVLMMSVTLAADHRVIDGTQGAEFLNIFNETINKVD